MPQPWQWKTTRALLLARQIGVEPVPIPPETCAALHRWWLDNYGQQPA